MICARCAREVALGALRCPNCSGDPLLDGRYRLDRPIAGDSVGVSYRATRIEDAVLVRARSCIVRRLPNEPERSARLAMLRELDHPALPRWLDEFVLGEGSLTTLWSIHEHVVGQSLAEAIVAAPEGRFDPQQTAKLLRELADVLAYLHEQRPPVVHGALSPAVVQVRSGNQSACLLDLGCASAAVHGASNRGLTETLAYAAPEQLYADPTPASDVWALGLLAIVALSGASVQSLRDTPHTVRWRERVSVDAKLAELLERALELEPSRRLGADELRDTLASMSPPSQPPRPTRRAAALEAGPTSVPPRPPERNRVAEVPIMRPDELSRELSQAHRAATVLAHQQRTQLLLARVVVVFVTALIAGLATYVAIALL